MKLLSSITVWVPNVCDKLHLGRPERVLFGEINVCFKETSFTAYKKYVINGMIKKSHVKKFTRVCLVAR